MSYYLRPIQNWPYTRKTSFLLQEQWEASNYCSPCVTTLSILHQLPAKDKESIPITQTSSCQVLNNIHAQLHTWICKEHPERRQCNMCSTTACPWKAEADEQQWGWPPQTWSTSPNPTTGTPVQQGAKACERAPKQKSYSQDFTCSGHSICHASLTLRLRSVWCLKYVVTITLL